MFIFITSLKHPTVTKKLDLVYKLLDRSLWSIENQTNSNFIVLIICHEIPKLSKEYHFVRFILTDIPPPVSNFEDLVCGVSRDEVFRQARHNLARADKWKKYLLWLYAAKEYNPSHIMFFDADDCVSFKLVETILSWDKNQSWVVQDGYIFCENSLWIKRRKNFQDICGTCYVFSSGLFSFLPDDPALVSKSWCNEFLGSHVLAKKWLAEEKIHLKRLQYPGVIYIIWHGENHWGISNYNNLLWYPVYTLKWCCKFLLHMLSYRLLTKRFVKEFNLISIN